MDPIQPKSSLKSVETYILAAVAMLGAVMSVLPEDNVIAKYIGIALTIASALGFGAMRTSVKNTAVKANAEIAKAAAAKE